MPANQERPRIKENISAIYRKIGLRYEVIFIHRASGTQQRFLVNELCFNCIRLFNGKNSVQEISRKMHTSEKDIRKVTKTLRAANITVVNNEPLFLRESRFSPQLGFLNDFASSKMSPAMMQSRLEAAHVAVVGVGGIGSWVSYGLSLAGISRLSLFDHDKVSQRNLSHQCLFDLGDVGHLKSEVLSHKLEKMFAALKVKSCPIRIDASNADILLEGSPSLVINCADEPDTADINRLITLACFKANIPHILCGGYNGHLSFLGPTVIPGKTACWFCYERSLHRRTRGFKDLELNIESNNVGSIAPIAAITANFHILEALKVLSGYSKPYLINKASEINYQDYSISTAHFKSKKGCFCENRD